MKFDTMRIKVLEDGTASIETDGISGTNHKSADELLDSLHELMGGERRTTSRKEHAHAHHGQSVQQQVKQ